MKRLLILAAVAAAALPVQPAMACPPPPPGWVPPTDEQRLESFVTQADDIVYGVITESGADANTPSKMKLYHVYRGGLRKGDTIAGVTSWEHPVPVCAGMMTPPPPKPAGFYGVAAVNRTDGVITFIKPEHVQLMIAKGWIKSAQAR